MKNISKLIVAGVCGLLLASCAINTSMPYMYTNNSIEKTGKASKTCPINMCFGNSDLSIKKAADNGGITKIATVDRYVEGNFFSVTYSTVVTGE